jgi:hypothetical protein
MVQKRSRSQKRSRQQRKSRSRRQRRSRSQRGGVWYNPLSWFSSEPQYYFGQEEETIVDKVGNTVKSGLDKADMALASASTAVSEGAQNLVQSTTDVLNTDIPILAPKEPEPMFPSIMPVSSTMGGKSRSRASSKARARYLAKKGGRGLGLTYYATPVEGINVAQPTYFENYNGGRRRRTMKRSRK